MTKYYAFNFTLWKRGHISAFLSSLQIGLKFQNWFGGFNAGELSDATRFITWASKNNTKVKALAEKHNVPLWYMEDGFIRSAGLGTDLTAPASLVLDKRGIYYDPAQPSDLEHLLESKDYSSEEIERAQKLRQQLIDLQVSKYNLGLPIDESRLKGKLGQTIILIPGQVEGDASIRKGCVDIRDNQSLIRSVRDENPDAYIIYKPHPDVVSGNRKGGVQETILAACCDDVWTDVSIVDCLDLVDEVHTMTSLVGFEALMRHKKVVCYGIPFYSNWGLTTDRHFCDRRTRKRNIDELVAATLIDYPMYMNWDTRALTTPEFIVSQIREKLDKQGGGQSVDEFVVIRFLRKVKNFLVGISMSIRL